MSPTTCSLAAFVTMSHMQLGFGGGGEEVGETAMADFVHVTYFSYC